MIKLTGLAAELFKEIAKIPVTDCHEHLPTEAERVGRRIDFTELFRHYTRADLECAGLPLGDAAWEQHEVFDTAKPVLPRWRKLKPYLEAIRDAPDHPTGQRHAQWVLAEFAGSYPSAMRSLADDLPASLAHLKLPPVHRRHVRTTNLIERAFEEERRRAKVIPRFRGEKECLKLVFGTLWRASERWRRVRFSELERRQIERYRQERQAERQKDEQTRNIAVVA